MVAILSIIFALGLLGLTVYFLHRHQAMEVEFSVDRSMPLPPLDSDFKAVIGLQSNLKTRSREFPTAEDTAPSSAINAAKHWQTSVSQLKKSGDISGALKLCRKEFPLWGAYNQACILLRSQLKSDQLTPTQVEDKLSELYRTAAIAELLHDTSPDFTQVTPKQLRKLELTQVEKLKLPYRELGYINLRLIRKSDIKQLHAHWGPPSQHSTPRQMYKSWWEETASELSQGNNTANVLLAP